jgi:hypothetical protein
VPSHLTPKSCGLWAVSVWKAMFLNHGLSILIFGGEKKGKRLTGTAIL